MDWSPGDRIVLMAPIEEATVASVDGVYVALMDPLAQGHEVVVYDLPDERYWAGKWRTPFPSWALPIPATHD